jgi:hypothetical protein
MQVQTAQVPVTTQVPRQVWALLVLFLACGLSLKCAVPLNFAFKLTR